MKFELNDVQLRNLLEFLKRSTLRGDEAAVFMNVVNALGNPIKEPEENKEGGKTNG